jgi:hypothetical protein
MTLRRAAVKRGGAAVGPRSSLECLKIVRRSDFGTPTRPFGSIIDRQTEASLWHEQGLGSRLVEGRLAASKPVAPSWRCIAHPAPSGALITAMRLLGDYLPGRNSPFHHSSMYIPQSAPISI